MIFYPTFGSKILFTGLESQGKSLLLAIYARALVERSRLWEKKHGFVRPLYSNLQFSDDFYNAYRDRIRYWENIQEVVTKVGCDVLWDEISTDFSAMKKEPLGKVVNRWLRQGAKQGLEIYATSQELHDVHLDYRRRIGTCFQVSKVAGSRRRALNMPPSGGIWGLCHVRELKIRPYNELEPEYNDQVGSFFLIKKEDTAIFNTNQVISSLDDVPFEHIVRKCSDPSCNFKKVIHR